MERRSSSLRETYFSLRSEIIKPTPFLISGHHIDWYIQLVKGTYYSDGKPLTPYAVASRQSAFYRQEMYFLRESGDKESADYKYLKDVIGSNWITSRIARYRDKKTLRKFVKLPDAYPVEIVAGRVDEMCKSCIHGKHCTTTSDTYGSEDAPRVRRDLFGVNLFIREARKLGLDEAITITQTPTEFTDADNYPVKTVQTTAGTFKEVIKQSRMLMAYDH